ncbi:hypothetical protein DOTSEDRAFT_72844 [Dothistroma septosporum NZE10]|uniref:PQ loop repeat protein n=1 Tax=Dothistroma septosporum (strain NZE10 / CBS 128990) TaxID=675120 RepID=M2WNL8_DOTSN|nr:hypothetical protein DOTSEDRAFT_72844 [Dothistroma septosporum NZE10]
MAKMADEKAGFHLANLVFSMTSFTIPASLEEQGHASALAFAVSTDMYRRIMALVSWVINRIAPIFIVTSPVTSYGDQIWSMHSNRSSAGFSLDIPLIMLVASVLKVFYWFGAHYDAPLLIQAAIMVIVQIVLLQIALLNRPPFGAQHSLNKPFAGATEAESYVTRPYNFWQWRSRKPYWQFLAYYTVTLAVLQLLVGTNELYIGLQGYVALSVEAILPIPQILENHRSRSSKGFRLSVLVNWLVGDVFKMTYFFLSEGEVPWAFKLCGMFQAACDCYLGVQYWMYGEGVDTAVDIDLKDPRLA